MGSVWRDVLYGARALAKQPGLACAVILLLAIGLGSSTAMFSVVSSVLLEPLEYADADRLVAVFRHDRSRNERRNPTSAADFLDWEEGSGTLELMTAARPWTPSLTGREIPDRLPGLMASPSLFSLLGAKPALGRAFDPDDHQVVVLSHDLWQRSFGSDPEIVGEALTLDGEAFEVIGVMPPGFAFPPFWATEAEFWAPVRWTEEEAANRRSQFLRVFARLNDGIDLDQARAELEALAARLERDYPDTNRNASIHIEPLREPVVGPVRTKLVVLLGAVGLVLLVTCANVAQLLLSRVMSRRNEAVLCLALGASRWHLVRAVLVESALLSVLGGVAGLLVARSAIATLRVVSSGALPRVASIAIDGRTFAFAALLVVCASVLFGAVPALAVSRTRTVPTRAGSPDGARGWLVVAQVALALMLVTGSGLLVRSVRALDALDVGFSRERLITMEIPFAGTPHEPPERQGRLFDEIAANVTALPGVQSAALVNHLPVGGDLWRIPFVPEGASSFDETPRASYRTIDTAFVRTFGARLESGRSFDERDTADGRPVVIVNRTLAERYFPEVAPVGRRIKLGDVDRDGPWLTIVGVVSDMRQWTLTDVVRPEILFPYAQNPASWWTTTTLVVRSELEPSVVVDGVRASVWAVDRNLPVTNVRTMGEILATDTRQARWNSWILGLFATSAVLLAGVGIYGLIAHAMSVRQREMGIRAALGAAPGRIVSLVLFEGTGLLLRGILLGGFGGVLAARAFAGLVFGIEVDDPLTFATAACVVFVAGVVASYLPARRTSRRSPVEVLR